MEKQTAFFLRSHNLLQFYNTSPRNIIFFNLFAKAAHLEIVTFFEMATTVDPDGVRHDLLFTGEHRLFGHVVKDAIVPTIGLTKVLTNSPDCRII